MEKCCEKCESYLGDVWHSTKYCDPCKKIARKEALIKFAPKAREKTKTWRKNNRERALKKQKECYYNKREYYLQKSKEYNIKNKLQIYNKNKIKRNQQPHRKILLGSDIVPKCIMCGATENYKGYQLSVHHIDGNHENNVFENLVWMCESCHQYVHNPNGINSDLIKVDKYEKKSRKCL